MQTDNELIKSYCRDRSENAFTELVRRHINMVFSAAVRETRGNAALAEEITQSVFTELARKADRLTGHPTLAGWLFTCVRHMSANALRAEERRKRRELQSQTMNELLSSDPSEEDWRQIQPALHDAMHQLNEKDRAVIVLRFLEERSLRDVALALGLNENAAHVRIHRALEKLRDLLAKRGITSTAGGLASCLAGTPVVPAPSSLVATVAMSALAASKTTSTTLGLIALLTMSKLKLSIIVVVIAACLLTTFVLVHQRSPGGQLSKGVPSGLAFAGYATPEATLQTECWAMSKGDAKLFLDGMTSEKHRQMEDSVMAKGGGMNASQITGFKILNKENISADEIVLTVRFEGGDNRDGEQKMRLQRLNGEWKVADATRQ